MKKSLNTCKTKSFFEELVNERVGELQNLSKQINVNKLLYYFKGESYTKPFISFKCPLGYYLNIKAGYTALEKAEENIKKINLI